MPITMMLVMTAIFETFVRSWSPLSKAVRALGRLWVDTRSAYQGNLTRLAAIKMGKNLSKLMLDPGLPGLGLHISEVLVLKKPSDRLFSCLPHLWVGMGIPSPTYIGQLISNPPLDDSWRLISSCWNLSAHFCQLKNHEQSKNHWHSSYCTSSLL